MASAKVSAVNPAVLSTEEDVQEPSGRPLFNAILGTSTSFESELTRGSRYTPVWRRAMFKIKAQKAINKVNEDILVYGTSNELTDMNMQYKINIDQLIETKSKKDERFRKLTTEHYYTADEHSHLISPNSSFKKFWNMLLALILVYTALVMPFRIAFFDVVFWDWWTILDFTIDGLFLTDVVIHFFSVQVNADGTLETNQWVIAKTYLKGWFFLDITACMPFSLLDMAQPDSQNTHSNKYNSLLRLARLPRLYKLFRVTRILKAFRHYRSSNLIERLQDFLQINSRLYKLIKFLVSVFVCVHVIGCFWYFSARVDNFSPDTWVTRTGHRDDDIWTLYTFSVYWAITTCVTVGYGDISARTELEMVICMIWMIAGVGFYSFTVGSLSSFLTSIDTRESILASKMAAIQEFAVETGISNDCKLKIRNAIKYNTYRTGTVWQDKHSLFNELPKALRYEVAISMYGGVAVNFPLLAGKDPAFINFVLPLFRPLKMESGEYLFREGEPAEEAFLITQGRVNLVVTRSEIVYKSFLRGSMVGDVEVLKQIRRISNALCHGVCEFLVLTNRDLAEIAREFPSEGRQMQVIAKEKARRIKQSFLETIELLRMKRVNGNVKDLAGHQRILEVAEDLNDIEDDADEAEKFLNGLSIIETDLRDSKARLFVLTKTIAEMRKSMALVVRRINRAAEKLEPTPPLSKPSLPVPL